MQRAARLLVLGIGNPSRTDDGVGQYVVEELNRHLGRFPASTNDKHSRRSAFTTVQTACVHQLTPELCFEIKDYDVVVFIDAHVGTGVRADQPVDTIDLSPVTPELNLTAVSHYWTAGSLLALTAQFFHHTPEGYMLSIAGRDFSFGDDLSPQTKEDADRAVQRLLEHIGGTNLASSSRETAREATHCGVLRNDQAKNRTGPR